MKKRLLGITALFAVICCLVGCQKKDPSPGELEGFDPGEQYLSIWVHSIEDTEEGQVYRNAVERFNQAFDGKYFADIEFVPRNDSGGGDLDKIKKSGIFGMVSAVLTGEGPNIFALSPHGII